MADMLKKPITLDVNHMMADTLGFQYGIARSQVEEYAPFAAAANQAVQAGRGKNWLGWMELPYNQAEIVDKLEKVAAKVREKFDTFVVLGIGGSALKSQYRAVCDTYTATDKYGHGIQQDFDTQADAAANLIRLCEPVLGSDNDAVFSAAAALDAWNTSAQENGAQPPVQYAANKQLYSAVDALYATGSAKASGDAKRQMDTQYDAFVSAQATVERAAAAYNQQADAYNKQAAAFPANVISALWGVGEVPSFSNTQ